MVTKLNPAVITDDMMYEDTIEPITSDEIDKLFEELRYERMWEDIHRVAKTNKALQSALEECIIIYKLSKEYQDGI